MKRLLIAFVFMAPTLNTRAAETDRDALRAIGATLKESGGVITDIRVDCTEFKDAQYELIASVTTLRSISISGKPMLDKHLELLTGLTELESILLNGTQLTDDGYRHFAAFKKLCTLSLFHPSRDCEGFTGSGLAHLKALPDLERLTFAGATAGNEAFAAVGQLTQLREFRQWHNWESPDGIKHLLNLKNLKSLKIGQRLPGRGRLLTPSFDDKTLAIIAQMQSLELVDLQEARLTYDGLVQLRTLPKLKQIKLKWIDVSKADIENLRTALPNVTIDWEELSEADNKATLSKKLKL